MNQFVHLHVHSEYSLLDGLGKIKDLVARAQQLGMPALALTDHGVMYGAVEFYLAAKGAGIKPIVGMEAYMARRTMYDREAEDKSSAHLLLLARDFSGYQSLVKLASAAMVDGFYYKPRIDRNLLEKHHEGLIICSSCPSGEIARAILRDDPTTAQQVAAYYRDLVGADNYYLEIQDHGLADQQKINRGVLDLSAQMGIPVVATNDVHYVLQEHADAQEILLCIQTNTTIDDPNRMRMETTNFYLRSTEEMAGVFGEAPEALRNTLRIAEQCNLDMNFDRVILPELDFIPEGMTPDEYLARLCWKGLDERIPDPPEELRHRLEYELSVIEKTGFAKYILFVYDYVSWARKRGIFCSPRGSAAGALALYCLQVADVNPIEYDLTFERFLNPDRVQMPDIDMDFQDNRRDEVIEYVTRKYGSDHVAQIVTFGRLAARAAIRDVGRAMDLPLPEVDKVAKLVPTLPVGMTIDKAMDENPDLRKMYEGEAHIKRLIDAAKSIEGVARHASTHAAGVVVSRDPLTELVPIQRATKGEDVMMAQYSMKPLEKIGLLKMDFLGLNNLTIVANTVKLVAQTWAREIDLAGIPLDDPAPFKMLSEGETTGIFQLEGTGMRRWVRELKPTSVRHLAAIVALYRPGPMAFIPTYIARKEGREPIQYLHPRLEPVLRETYGVMVYQDQVLKSVVAAAGFTMGQADVLRNAMSKKIRDVMAQQKDRFLEGCQKNGITLEGAERIWEQIEPFAGYGFNKAHAACYAMLAYQTAYLKTHYPVEYMTALLTSYAADTDKIILTLGECGRMNVTVLPPHINKSVLQFNVEPLPGASSPLKPDEDSRRQLAIRFGMIGVKNVGENAVQSIIAEREKAGPFRSLQDFCKRVDARIINKRVVESLIKCGSMDDFGDRGDLMARLDQTLDAAQQEQRAQQLGQFTMFDSMFGAPSGATTAITAAAVPTVGKVLGQREKLAWEKEVLGLYLSSHPFAQAAPFLRGKITATSADIGEEMDGKRVVVAGTIASVKALTTKKGDRMAAVQMEDLQGGMEVVVFPRTYERTRDVWQEDAVVIVDGKVDAKEEGRKKVICEKAEAFVVPEGAAPPADVAEGPFRAPAEELSAAVVDEEGAPLEEPDLPGWEEMGASVGPLPLGEGRGEGALVGPLPLGEGRGEGERFTLPSSGVRTEKSVLTVSGNGHGNGNGNGNGKGTGQKKPANGSANGNGKARKPIHVQITLTRRGTDEEDAETLRQVLRAMACWAGQDSYELCIADSHERTYLECPGATTTFNPQLEAQLKDLLGPDCISIAEPTTNG